MGQFGVMDMPVAAAANIARVAHLPSGTAFVDAFIIDVNGIPRGKRLPASSWPAAAANGVAFSASSLVLDARGEAQGPLGVGTRDGDPDATGFPVPGTCVAVPWSDHAVAQCLLSMRGTDGMPIWFDPRTILQRVTDRCRADGLHPVVSCELEFYLVGQDANGRVAPPDLPRGNRQPGNAGHLCLQRVEEHAGFLHRLHEALAVQGVAGGTLVSEYGPGQFELNLNHTPDPLLAADQAVLQRRATIGVAASMGQRASFMAKPYAQHSGNGLHIHMSLVDSDGRNRFGAAGGDALLGHAIAGMQRLHAQSMALFAPSFSAYRRYRPGSFVALASTWGEDSRSVAFRIPRSGPGARRVEHRLAGADASPHLVMAALLSAAHFGITHRLTPGEAADRHAPAVADPALPRDIFAALAAFEEADVLGDYLGVDFLHLFAALKRAEAAELLADVFPLEHEFYL
jgi:glutamine synthetase